MALVQESAHLKGEVSGYRAGGEKTAEHADPERGDDRRWLCWERLANPTA